MLRIENLHKSFGEKEVLHSISIDVPDGKIVGFIGKNGVSGNGRSRCKSLCRFHFDGGQTSLGTEKHAHRGANDLFGKTDFADGAAGSSVMVSVIVLLIRFEQPAHIVVLGALLILFEGFGDALLGLLINLSYPKLDWDREVVVYKRSFSSLLGVVWGIVFNMVLLSVSLSIQPDPDLCSRIAVMVLGPQDLLLLWELNTKGIELFHKLS